MALKKPTSKTTKQQPKKTNSKLVKPESKELNWSEMANYLKTKSSTVNQTEDLSKRRYFNI